MKAVIKVAQITTAFGIIPFATVIWRSSAELPSIWWINLSAGVLVFGGLTVWLIGLWLTRLRDVGHDGSIL